MTDHVLDFSESPAYLRVKHQQLVIERKQEEPVSVPLAEVAVLVLAHPQITCTHAVLSVLMEKGGAVVVCDERNLPVGLMLPTCAHFTQAERIVAQVAAPLPVRKRIWQRIVRYKIRNQAALLQTLHGGDHGLTALISTVRSGDPKNVEAQAARRYWPALFDDPNFRRRREAGDQNRMLNYGYAVLRATIGRAVCAAGLHPSLGVHHHNRYDAFCLADDLMEPYRPLIDEAVVDCINTFGKDAALDRPVKTALLEAITGRYRCEGEVRSLFDLAARSASSLAKIFLGEDEGLFFPEVIDCAQG